MMIVLLCVVVLCGGIGARAGTNVALTATNADKVCGLSAALKKLANGAAARGNEATRQATAAIASTNEMRKQAEVSVVELRTVGQGSDDVTGRILDGVAARLHELERFSAGLGLERQIKQTQDKALAVAREAAHYSGAIDGFVRTFATYKGKAAGKVCFTSGDGNTAAALSGATVTDQAIDWDKEGQFTGCKDWPDGTATESEVTTAARKVLTTKNNSETRLFAGHTTGSAGITHGCPLLSADGTGTSVLFHLNAGAPVAMHLGNLWQVKLGGGNTFIEITPLTDDADKDGDQVGLKSLREAAKALETMTSEQSATDTKDANAIALARKMIEEHNKAFTIADLGNLTLNGWLQRASITAHQSRREGKTQRDRATRSVSASSAGSNTEPEDEHTTGDNTNADTAQANTAQEAKQSRAPTRKVNAHTTVTLAAVAAATAWTA